LYILDKFAKYLDYSPKLRVVLFPGKTPGKKYLGYMLSAAAENPGIMGILPWGRGKGFDKCSRYGNLKILWVYPRVKRTQGILHPR
jgi:hypothetical protein